MKRLLLMAFAMFSMTVLGVAQTGLKCPVFTKALKVTSNGINIRQAPSTQSAKLGNSPEYLLVIDEDAEWYHACVLKEGVILPQPGYVSKKVCKVKEAPIIDASYVRSCWEEAGVSLVNRTSGKYNGYSIITYYNFYKGIEQHSVFIGKKVGNVYIGKQSYYDRVWSDDSDYMLMTDKGEQITVPMSRVGNEDNVNWNKLTDSEIDKIMLLNGITVMVAGTQTHYYRDGLGEVTDSGNGVVTYSFDSTKYKGEATIIK